MKKIRISFVLFGRTIFGGERVVFEILKRLSKKEGLELTLFTNEEMIFFYSKIKNLSIINLGKIGHKNIFSLRNTISRFAKKLDEILINQRFNLIHLHMESPLEIMGRINNQNIPLISTLHGSELITFSNSFLNNIKLIKKFGLFYFIKMIYYKKIIKPFILNTLNNSVITLISQNQLQNLPTKYKQKAIVIPNGVDSEAFKPLKNIKQKKNIILFAGRFIELKGINEILSIAKQLPQYEFWFAGQGELNNLIVGKNVKNLGFQTTEQLVKLYNQAEICIFPSYRESFGLTGLEAMSCGRAVIATPLGFSEYIENGKDGIIIPTKDENALKNAIVDLMTNERKRKLLEKNAREKALKYSWDKVVEQYLNVYKPLFK